MPILAFKADSPIGSFSGGMPETVRRWHKGEERVVSDATAEYLLKDFGEVFEQVDVVASAVASPDADAAVKAPKKKAAPRKRAPRKKAAAKAGA